MENDLLIVQKLFTQERKSIKFLENYYADVLKAPNLKIQPSYHEETSYCDIVNKRIVISAQNLKTLMFQDTRISFKMFYTLLLHELGHAIYTPLKIKYSDVFNILEDNRLEFQITLWNKAVRFDIIRYALFDKVIPEQFYANPIQILSNPTSIGLCLLRTLDNSFIVDYFKQEPEKYDKVKRILKLDWEFTMENAKSDMSDAVIEKLEKIVEEVRQLLSELAIPPKEKPKPVVRQQQSKGKGGGGSSPSKTQPNKDKLEQELNDIEQENEKIKEETDNGMGMLLNENPKLDDYVPLDISAFQVARTMGIRGTGKDSRRSGTPKDLSLRKYMRRGFERNVKPFEKQTDVFSVGGKTTMVSFYLDISGSMSGEKTLLTTRYLKTFYDKMSSHMYIRFFGFGSNTYEITRNELEYAFLENALEGSTYIQLIPQIKPNEHVIILTDGFIHGDIPQEYREKATFILVSNEPDLNNRMVENITKGHGVNERNVILVDTQNITEGLDRATAFIKRVLQ